MTKPSGLSNKRHKFKDVEIQFKYKIKNAEKSQTVQLFQPFLSFLSLLMKNKLIVLRIYKKDLKTI